MNVHRSTFDEANTLLNIIMAYERDTTHKHKTA